MFLTLFVIAGAVTFAVLNHRNQYVSIQTASQRSEEAKKAEAIEERMTVLETENANLKKDNQFLRDNCLRGAAAFSRLSLANQRANGTINCGE